MNIRAIFIYIGYILLVEGAFMLPALLIAVFQNDMAGMRGFLFAIALLLLLGSFLIRKKRDEGMIEAQEGFVTVALGWILLSVFGALPFIVSGTIPRFEDAFFETVSGFTTTGASILRDVESLSDSMLYWRSFTHWLGGMGVLVFMLAIVPLSKGKGETFHLLRAESPGPSVGKLTPRLSRTARILYLIYIAITLTQIVLLTLGGMPLFDSILTSFGTVGTGGFGIKNNSVAYYNSAYLQTVIGIFMMLCGINFSLFYMLLLKQFRAVYKNEELRAYLLIIGVVTAMIALDILPAYNGREGRAVLDSFFQVSSIITTTGYSTVDFNLWPQLSRFLLVMLMIFGACAGSTGGGMKISRILLLMKYMKSQLMLMLRPRAIKPVRMDNRVVDEAIMRGTHTFLIAYVLICVFSLFPLTFEGYDMETNITAVLSCVNNIGPGLSLVGPMGNFGFFNAISKLTLSLLMLTGRLEIFPMLLLFSLPTWKKRA